MRRLMLCAIVLVLVALPWAVQAQTPVPSPTTQKLAFDHDGLNTDGYRLKIDAAAATVITPTCAVVSSVRTCELAFPALTPGPHSLVVVAFNAAGEAASDPFAVLVFVAPVKPANVRIKAAYPGLP